MNSSFTSGFDRGRCVVTAKCDNPAFVCAWLDLMYDPFQSPQNNWGTYGEDDEFESTRRDIPLTSITCNTSDSLRTFFMSVFFHRFDEFPFPIVNFFHFLADLFHQIQRIVIAICIRIDLHKVS